MILIISPAPITLPEEGDEKDDGLAVKDPDIVPVFLKLWREEVKNILCVTFPNSKDAPIVKLACVANDELFSIIKLTPVPLSIPEYDWVTPPAAGYVAVDALSS